MDSKILEQIKINNPFLTTLDLSNKKLNDEDIKQLCKALENNIYLKRLILRNNHIFQAGAVALAEFLKNSGCLVDLDLSHNNLGDGGTKALCDGLKLNKSIRELYLSGNAIGPESSSSINELLCTSTTIQTLDLSNNELSDQGVSGILQGLNDNESLHVINLANNELTAQCTESLNNTLQINKTLQKLDLSRNLLGDEGCKLVCDSLSNNSTLKVLDLGDNAIGTKGYMALLQAVGTNTGIQQLSLVGNPIKARVKAGTIENALKNNCTLLSINPPEPALLYFLEKNNKLHNIIIPLFEVINAGTFFADRTVLENTLEQVNQFIVDEVEAYDSSEYEYVYDSEYEEEDNKTERNKSEVKYKIDDNSLPYQVRLLLSTISLILFHKLDEKVVGIYKDLQKIHIPFLKDYAEKILNIWLIELTLKEEQWSALAYIISKQPDCSIRTEENETPLCFAANNGQWETVGRLAKSIAKSENPNDVADAGKVIRLLVKNKQQRDLLKSLVKIPNINLSWVHDYATAKLLIDHGFDLNKKFISIKRQNATHETVIQLYSPMDLALKKLNWDEVLYLAKHGADLSLKYKGVFTPIVLAAKEDRWDIVLELFELIKEKPNASDELDIGNVIQRGAALNKSISRYLKGNNISDCYDVQGEFKGFGALHHAVAHKNYRSVNHLLAYGYDVNARYLINGQLGPSPLEIAINKKDHEGMLLLIAAGANIDALPKDNLHSLEKILDSLLTNSITSCVRGDISKFSCTDATRNELRQILTTALVKNKQFCETILFDNHLPYSPDKVPLLDQLALYISTHLLVLKTEVKGFFRNHRLNTIQLSHNTEIPQEVINKIFESNFNTLNLSWPTPWQ